MDRLPLGTLPPEIRNYIGELVLAQPRDIHVASQMLLRKSLRPPLTVVGRSKHALALTRLCRQLRAENKSIFFFCNSFVLKLRMLSKSTKTSPRALEELGATESSNLELLEDFLRLARGRWSIVRTVELWKTILRFSTRQ